MVLLFCIYTLVFGLLMWSCYKKEAKPYYYTLAKLINSLLFIIVATCGMLTSKEVGFYTLLLPALIACLIGDVLLGLSDSKSSQNLFLGGLVSFLIGHILFVRAFSHMQPLSRYDFIMPIGVVLLTWGLCQMKGMNTQKMRPYILIYSFFVALLFSKSLSIVYVTISARNILLCIGSLLFLISDTIILFLYFYEKKYRLVPFFNLLTYYYGMFFIALSVFFL